MAFIYDKAKQAKAKAQSAAPFTDSICCALSVRALLVDM
jgi:hypothetical protein